MKARHLRGGRWNRRQDRFVTTDATRRSRPRRDPLDDRTVARCRSRTRSGPGWSTSAAGSSLPAPSSRGGERDAPATAPRRRWTSDARACPRGHRGSGPTRSAWRPWDRPVVVHRRAGRIRSRPNSRRIRPPRSRTSSPDVRARRSRPR